MGCFPSISWALNFRSLTLLYDRCGSLAILLSPWTQKPVETYRYTAFGEELTTAKGSSWRFSSKRMDQETGFVYFGRRYYFPALGRWLTPDPQGFLDGPNLYAYLSNAPLTHVDLYGLWQWESYKKQAYNYVDNFFAFATPIAHANYHSPANTSFWKRGAYTVAGGLELALLPAAVSKAGLFAAEKGLYQMSSHAYRMLSKSDRLAPFAQKSAGVGRRVLEKVELNLQTLVT